MESEAYLRHSNLSSTATKLVTTERGGALSIFATTWDGNLQCFNFNPKFNHVRQLKKFNLSKNSLPILGLAVSDSKVYYSCEESNNVHNIYEMDINSDNQEITKIGTHREPINHLMLTDDRTLYSFSWDGNCKIWDLRQPDDGQIITHKLQHSGSVVDVKRYKENLVGIVGGDKFFILNTHEITKDPTYFTLKTSSQDQMLTSLAIDPSSKDGLEFSVGTADGRIIYSRKDLKKTDPCVYKSMWRSHYYDTRPNQLMFPVKGLVYHPTFEKLLFSGGDDGKVNFHDVNKSSAYKKDLFQDDVPVTHVDIESEGQFLIMAKGYGWRTSEDLIMSKSGQAKLYVYNLVDSDMPPEEDE